MVNKALLGLIAVALCAVFGTGLFVGMQLGGPGAGPAGEPTPQSGQEVGTGTPAPTATPEPTAESTPTQEPENGGQDEADDEPVSEREPIPSYEFSEAAIREQIVADINAAREAEGLDPLSTTGATATRVRLMAENHTDAMLQAGRVAHTIDGVTSRDRYERNGLYTQCQVNVGNYIERADNNALEVVGTSVAGQTYTYNGSDRFDENDTAVADAFTEGWLSTQSSRDILLIKNANRIGVGVSVNFNSRVYATVNICG